MIRPMHWLLGIVLLLAASPAGALADEQTMVLVAGTGGTEAYRGQFQDWVQQWQQVANTGGVQTVIAGADVNQGATRAELEEALAKQAAQGSEPLWLVLLGHGTWDGKEGKFNLRGDDLSAGELANLLKRVERPVVVVAAFSASGAWVKPLAAPGRIVLAATRSGSEENFARLGQYFPACFIDPAADLDKDGQVSLLEAWLSASKKTAAYYSGEGRLATEHSILDDNADGRGTPSDWFQGIRLVKKSKENASADGQRAHQIHLVRTASEKSLAEPLRAERDALELEIAKLREAKGAMEEEVYYAALETLLVRLAKVYAD